MSHQEPSGWTMCRRSQTIQDLQHQGQFSIKVFTLYEKPSFDANISEQWLMFALVGHIGVFRASVAAAGFQGVIWNFTDILTRVFTMLLCTEPWDLTQSCCSQVSDLLLSWKRAVRSAAVCQTCRAVCVCVCVFGQPSHCGPY